MEAKMTKKKDKIKKIVIQLVALGLMAFGFSLLLFFQGFFETHLFKVK